MKIAEYNQMYKHLIRPSDQNERIKKYFEKNKHTDQRTASSKYVSDTQVPPKNKFEKETIKTVINNCLRSFKWSSVGK